MAALMGRCPQCSKPALIAPENPWRPVCCERCKLLDLGDWMNGRFVIPVAADDEAEFIVAPEDRLQKPDQ